MGVPFNISVIVEASEFKGGIELGFSTFNFYKMTPTNKSGRGPRLGASKNLGFPVIFIFDL